LNPLKTFAHDVLVIDPQAARDRAWPHRTLIHTLDEALAKSLRLCRASSDLLALRLQWRCH